MTTFPRPAAFALPALALLAGLVAGCASAGAGGQVAAGARQPAGASLTVEQLSAKVGCTPRMQVDAADLRTGYCRTADGEFFVTTFRTQAEKDRWMDAAPEYNPHLVGHLWTVLSSRKVLDLLRERLGGDLHLTDHRTKRMRTVG
ncbi:hypothetical protein FH608_026835 [Nonomuraea phyllanthi]|uniref:Uncharacterized protein n=1 Tax=Nonomuraea phyllanthi TaxID=2219224 RepID=A0A5C4W6W5_9ACTN|nr:hypothetical protein [Nonomuraea phyllanthi]KAB8192298.1 hypothetical protein FH608_026835 [Nonomuraea phyllanthi]QFY11347.1 hypothetical protein GBF35_36460 [Nonomuraea phyllanthi]